MSAPDRFSLLFDIVNVQIWPAAPRAHSSGEPCFTSSHRIRGAAPRPFVHFSLSTFRRFSSDGQSAALVTRTSRVRFTQPAPISRQ